MTTKDNRNKPGRLREVGEIIREGDWLAYGTEGSAFRICSTDCKACQGWMIGSSVGEFMKVMTNQPKRE